MPPTPISAPNRLVLRYTVRSFQHKAQFYLDTVPSADSSGYDAIGRLGLGNVGVSLLGNAFFTVVAPFYNTTDTTFDNWELQSYSSPSWVYVASATITATPGSGTPQYTAFDWCIMGKDVGNKSLPAYIFEGNFRLPSKISSYASMNTAEKAITDYFFRISGTAAATDAWNWRKSRGDTVPGRWLACIWDTNEKLRRLRGIK